MDALPSRLLKNDAALDAGPSARGTRVERCFATAIDRCFRIQLAVGSWQSLHHANRTPPRAITACHQPEEKPVDRSQRCPTLVELDGIEPTASCLQSRRSPN